MTTYYISPNGSNINTGLSTSSPWKTFLFVIPNLVAGDNLILMDGEYSNVTGTGLPFISGKNGTATAFITIKALNERQALLQGDGNARPFYLLNSSYWNIEGLRTKWGDYGGSGASFIISGSNNINVKRLLASHPDRIGGPVNNPGNNNVVDISTSHHILVEESEFYYFHKNALSSLPSSYNITFRRNYAHSRDYPNVNPLTGGCTATGDAAFYLSSSDSISENNIAENVCIGYDVNATDYVTNVKLYGNIAKDIINKNIGIADLYNIPAFRLTGATNSLYINNVAIDSGIGFGITNGTGIILDQNSVIDTKGISTFGVYLNQGICTVKNTHTLATTGIGFMSASMTSWSFDYCNAYGVTIGYSPNDSRVTNSTQIDPQLGNYMVMTPPSSPMKGAGLNGADIGANILYRYEDGILTNVPLWDTITGEFPHGAKIAGVNDSIGQSAFDVHTRLGTAQTAQTSLELSKSECFIGDIVYITGCAANGAIQILRANGSGFGYTTIPKNSCKIVNITPDSLGNYTINLKDIILNINLISKTLSVLSIPPTCNPFSCTITIGG